MLAILRYEQQPIPVRQEPLLNIGAIFYNPGSACWVDAYGSAMMYPGVTGGCDALPSDPNSP